MQKSKFLTLYMTYYNFSYHLKNGKTKQTKQNILTEHNLYVSNTRRENQNDTDSCLYSFTFTVVILNGVMYSFWLRIPTLSVQISHNKQCLADKLPPISSIQSVREKKREKLSASGDPATRLVSVRFFKESCKDRSMKRAALPRICIKN